MDPSLDPEPGAWGLGLGQGLVALGVGRGAWDLGRGHGAWGMGHAAWGMGHRTQGMGQGLKQRFEVVDGRVWEIS